MDAKITGKIIHNKRKELGLTQIQLAQKLNVTNRAISKWENGDGFPDITLLPDISRLLGITIDELLTGIEPEPIIKYIEKQNDNKDNNYKKAQSKFLISEIIAFCLSITAGLIGITTEFILFGTRPFYAFIEIYLLVATIALLIVSIIVFLTGFVKLQAEIEKTSPKTLIEFYIFSVITSITPAFVVYRMLTETYRVEYNLNSRLLKNIFLWLYAIVLIIFTFITAKKIKGAKNENKK